MEPYSLTAVEASRQIREGNLTPLELLNSCLDRINLLESNIEAWVTVDAEKAIKTAKQLTNEVRKGSIKSRLNGVPIGFKDIYNIRGLQTTMGSSLFRGNISEMDAEIVSKLRKAGAIILGKTETTEFAFLDPAPTKNPWNINHTPGGSSSGSAAAVSAEMCPLAFGSQTGGSIIRPASFCGVIGFKPTYDLLSRKGIFPLAWSLDHAGYITRSVEDALLTLEILADRNCSRKPISKPRFAYVQGYFNEQATAEVNHNFLDAVDKLRKSGAEIEKIELTEVFKSVHASHRIIMAAEAAAIHQERFTLNPDDYKRNIGGLIASGLIISSSTYLQARRVRGIFIQDMLKIMSKYDALLTPSAPTPAPLSLQTTGNANFNAPWSLTGFPTLTIPSGLNREGLPLGLQITAKPYDEARLFSVGAWCELKLGSIGTPHPCG